MLMQVKILLAALAILCAACIMWMESEQQQINAVHDADMSKLRYMANHPASYSR